MAKYSGMWTPDMGAGDDDQSSPALSRSELPASRYYSQQYDAYRRRREQQDALQPWMQGFEPVERWEKIDGHAFHSILYMEFPQTNHDVICFDLWTVRETLDKANHMSDWGTVVLWCFGCWTSTCGACQWARKVFKKGRTVQQILTQDDDDDGLPF